jgi:capsular polysaccharide biosynthesis protein
VREIDEPGGPGGTDGPGNGRAGRAVWQPVSPAGARQRPLGGSTEPAVPDGLLPGRPGMLSRAVLLSLLALAFVITVLAAGVALAGALVWPKTYAARAEVLFPITQEQPTGFLREDRSLTTQLVLMRGRPVLEPIARQQGRTVKDLQRHLTVTIVDSSEIIQLEVRDHSADRAIRTVQAVVHRYLELSQATQPVQRQRLETELLATNTALNDAQATLSAQQAAVAAGTAEPATLLPVQQTAQAQQLRQQQLQAQLDAIIFAPVAQLLTPPYPAGAVSPRPWLATGTGALLGVVLAAGAVAVVARGRTGG